MMTKWKDPPHGLQSVQYPRSCCWRDEQVETGFRCSCDLALSLNQTERRHTCRQLHHKIRYMTAGLRARTHRAAIRGRERRAFSRADSVKATFPRRYVAGHRYLQCNSPCPETHNNVGSMSLPLKRT